MTGSYHYAEHAAAPGAPLLFLLHGTGGDENDLLALGRELVPEAHLVAPRGDVSEGGALRFFRRTGEGVYDMADLARATKKLNAFFAAHVERLAPSAVAALGYSNGANVLASALFASPGPIDRAVLMHPLIPFAPAPQPALARVGVLLTAGRRDPISPAPLTLRLAEYFAAQGADTGVIWHEGGHELRPEELAAAARFLRTGELPAPTA
ncbi:MAG TPA: alpha/beta hydrolase [Devosia sp.]|jgi:phospholipase/carboxylesterase|nr:alpha/beta hydrolase [Devosia sp.]